MLKIIIGHHWTLFFFCFILGLPPWHMEIPRLGVYSELQLPAYATATATPDLSYVCDRHHSSRQHQILNPLSEAGDRTHNHMVPLRHRRELPPLLFRSFSIWLQLFEGLEEMPLLSFAALVIAVHHISPNMHTHVYTHACAHSRMHAHMHAHATVFSTG